MPHKLMEEALKRLHVPDEVCDLLIDNYSAFQQRVKSGSVISDWHKIERGIITGCTISAILFSLAKSMVVKAAEQECRDPLSKSGACQPPIRAYMGEATVTTQTVIGCRWIVKALEKQMTWARMHFKPGKSRSPVIKKGKVVDEITFKISNEKIPTLRKKPIRSLGKVFDCSLKDKSAISET